jgi:hypothetical protein
VYKAYESAAVFDWVGLWISINLGPINKTVNLRGKEITKQKQGEVVG